MPTVESFARLAEQMVKEAAGIRGRTPQASSTSTHIMRAEAAAIERCARAIRQQIAELEAS